jgi:hypothetical protein
MPEMHSIEHSDCQPDRFALPLSEFGKGGENHRGTHSAWEGTAL